MLNCIPRHVSLLKNVLFSRLVDEIYAYHTVDDEVPSSDLDGNVTVGLWAV